jgi:hypothetical protein
LGDEESQEKKDKAAKEVAAAMVENMKKNIEDPDFLDKREKMLDDVADEVLKRREERRKKFIEE